MDRGPAVEELPKWLQTEPLTEFLMGLRLSGYRLGAQEFILIEDLILALLGTGERFNDPVRLANVLAPVICKSEAEQADFHRRFADWCLPDSDPKRKARRALPAEASNFDSALRNLGKERRLWKRVRAAGLVLLAFTIVWLLIRQFS